MSQIPIGSPPAPPGRHAAPPGWYADPLDRTLERYWDGWQWSRTTRTSEHAVSAPSSRSPVAPGSDRSAATGRPGTGRSTGSSGWGSSTPGAVSRPSSGGFATSAPGTQPMLTADGVPMAAWGFRAVAALFDMLLTGLVGVALATPFYRPMWDLVTANFRDSLAAAQQGRTPPASPSMADFMASMSSFDRMMIGLIAAVVGIGYCALMWRLKSATLGQMIFGLRVVPVDHAQQTPQISWSAAFIRAFVWVVPRLTAYLVLFWVLNCLFPLWNAKRQAMHDLAAKTQVVKIR